MDNEEIQRQRLNVAKALDEILEDLVSRNDHRIVLSVLVGRCVGFAKQLRETGTFSREDAIMYFGTALSEATAPLPEVADAEVDSPALQ